MLTGTISKYDNNKKFGFIRCSGQADVHFSLSKWLASYPPRFGEAVEFEVIYNQDGRQTATHVQPLPSPIDLAQQLSSTHLQDAAPSWRPAEVNSTHQFAAPAWHQDQDGHRERPSTAHARQPYVPPPTSHPSYQYPHQVAGQQVYAPPTSAAPQHNRAPYHMAQHIPSGPQAASSMTANGGNVNGGGATMTGSLLHPQANSNSSATGMQRNSNVPATNRAHVGSISQQGDSRTSAPGQQGSFHSTVLNQQSNTLSSTFGQQGAYQGSGPFGALQHVPVVQPPGQTRQRPVVDIAMFCGKCGKRQWWDKASRKGEEIVYERAVPLRDERGQMVRTKDGDRVVFEKVVACERCECKVMTSPLAVKCAWCEYYIRDFRPTYWRCTNPIGKQGKDGKEGCPATACSACLDYDKKGRTRPTCCEGLHGAVATPVHQAGNKHKGCVGWVVVH